MKTPYLNKIERQFLKDGNEFIVAKFAWAKFMRSVCGSETKTFAKNNRILRDFYLYGRPIITKEPISFMSDEFITTSEYVKERDLLNERELIFKQMKKDHEFEKFKAKLLTDIREYKDKVRLYPDNIIVSSYTYKLLPIKNGIYLNIRFTIGPLMKQYDYKVFNFHEKLKWDLEKDENGFYINNPKQHENEYYKGKEASKAGEKLKEQFTNKKECEEKLYIDFFLPYNKIDNQGNLYKPGCFGSTTDQINELKEASEILGFSTEYVNKVTKSGMKPYKTKAMKYRIYFNKEDQKLINHPNQTPKCSYLGKMNIKVIDRIKAYIKQYDKIDFDSLKGMLLFDNKFKFNLDAEIAPHLFWDFKKHEEGKFISFTVPQFGPSPLPGIIKLTNDNDRLNKEIAELKNAISELGRQNTAILFKSIEKDKIINKLTKI